jgi:glutaryl-CoA dehydrogenase
MAPISCSSTSVSDDRRWCATASRLHRRSDAEIHGALRRGTFPKELIQPLADLGVFGANIQGYECAGLNNVAYGLIMQELERGDSGLRSFASVQSGLVMYPIHAFGDDEQKNKWLPALAKGKVIGCFGLTEADRSNPRHADHLTATYVPNGSKAWINNVSPRVCRSCGPSWMAK